MPKWGSDSEEDVDVFGDVIAQQVPVVGSSGGVQRGVGKASIMGDAHNGPKTERMKFSGLQVTVPHYKVMGTDKKSYVAYVILCQGPEAAWQVHKRFSEFATLHTSLVTSKGYDARKIPAFPSKMKRPLESDVTLIRRRVEQLGKYIAALWTLAEQGKIRRQTLERFLQEDSHAMSPRSRSAPGEPEVDDDDSESCASPLLLESSNAEEGGFIKLPSTPWTPNVTVMSSPDEHLIALDLPGIAEKEVTVTALDNGLRVFGERNLDLPNSSIVHNERKFGSLAVDFIVPEKYSPFTLFKTRMHLGVFYISFCAGYVLNFLKTV